MRLVNLRIVSDPKRIKNMSCRGTVVILPKVVQKFQKTSLSILYFVMNKTVFTTFPSKYGLELIFSNVL